MKVFLTGATGFVGSHFLDSLVGNGHDVMCSVRTELQESAIVKRGATAWREGLRDGSSLELALSGVDVLIHAAACVELGSSVTQFQSSNVALTQSLLSAARQANVPRFIYISAASVAMHSPIAMLNVDESSKQTGADYLPYSTSKAIAERAVLAAGSRGLSVMVLRPSFIWGSGDSVDRHIGPASQRGQFGWFNQGRYLFSTCFIANLCIALEQALSYTGPKQVFFISDAESVELRSFLSRRLAVGGFKVPSISFPRWLAWGLARFTENGWTHLPLPGKPPLVREMVRLMGYPFTVSIQAARAELGYEPRYTVEEGMQILADQHATQPRVPA